MNRKVIAALLVFAGAVVFAAATFIANDQPYGYIAPPALNTSQVLKGNTVAYTPWFEPSTFQGDLLALPVASNGVVNVLSPLWQSATVLDGQNFDFGRRIVTTDGNGTAIPFRFANLTAGQQGAVVSETLLNFIRGDRTQEGIAYRTRSSVLGAIIHSAPVYVQKAVDGYPDGGYLSYAVTQAARSPRVYVGANDGMLHAFNADTGAEVFAYVPSMVIDKLRALATAPYRPTYYVDGALTTGDVYFGGAWHTVLVGGLGAGGKGYYALDITDANAANEAAAAAKILWEFHAGSAGAGNLGFSYSRPSIVKLNNGQWAAVVANGYLSGTGAASLLFLDIRTGVVIRELTVPDLASNGLSSPTLIDTTGDRTPDVAYAGDLNGNLWKFDISAGSTAAWSSQLLFQTDNSSGVRQPISTAPDVGFHPEGGYLVYVATGRLFDEADGNDTTQQAVYGIWDNDWTSGLPIAIGSLLTQQLIGTIYGNAGTGEEVRTVTAYVPDWSTHRGWRTPLEIASPTAADQGERVIQDIHLSDGRVQIASVNPTVAGGANWYLQLDGRTGGAPSKTILDLNGDFAFNVYDNADGDGDGAINDTPVDRVVGEFQSSGLMSRAVVGRLATGDTALINHLAAINPLNDLPPEPGLAGGHFDVDTSHLIYPFDTGLPECDEFGLPVPCTPKDSITTDGHVHQWDDDHNLTTIDYFDMLDPGKLFEINDATGFGIAATDQPFVLTIANSELSPGGLLTINGIETPVVEYQARLNRYLTGTLLPGEAFPVYTFGSPGKAIGKGLGLGVELQQLLSLTLGFDVNAILDGGLLPTKTGCVKGNVPGAKGEYRNGALMIQALDASDVEGGYVLDVAADEYRATSNSIHASLGYATAGLLWESTVFWHWDGPCYGDDANWVPLYEACVVLGIVTCVRDEAEEKIDDKKDGGGGGVDEPPPLPPEPPPAPSDPGFSVTNTTIGGNNDVGPLFWRELIPED